MICRQAWFAQVLSVVVDSGTKLATGNGVDFLIVFFQLTDETYSYKTYEVLKRRSNLPYHLKQQLIKVKLRKAEN